MRNMYSLAAGLLGVSLSLTCLAETEAERQGSLQTLSSPGGTASSGQSFVNSASIEAGTSDTKASLSVTGYTPESFVGDYLYYQIGGEAPVTTKGSTDEIDIGTVSGLTAGSSAHAEISAMWWKHQPKPVQDSMDAICRREFPKLFVGNTIGFDDGWLSDMDTGCDRALFTAAKLSKMADGFNNTIKLCTNADKEQREYQEARRKYDASLKAYKDNSSHGDAPEKPAEPTAPPADLRAKCTAKDYSNLPSKVALSSDAKSEPYLRQRQAEIDKQERLTSPVTLLTLGTKVNRQKDAYFNKTDLSALIKDHTTGYGVNLTWSRIQTFGRLDGMYSAGFSYEKTYKGDDPTQVCSPSKISSTALTCATGTIGAPKEMFSRIVFAESRLMIITGALAVAPRVEYDFTASKFAAKLPIYVAPDKNKTLSGGITLGYVTHGDGFGAAVFVNKAFSFF